MTVPECLDILLLHPTVEGQEWVKRLHWIIFDEVHGINEFERGPIWERLLHLTAGHTPFLALSATIGNAEDFRRWLCSHGTQVELIEHHERYNDLRIGVAKVTSQDAKDLVQHVHPCCFVTASQLRTRGFPEAVNFEARDSVRLFDVMKGENMGSHSLEDLEPKWFFAGSTFITRHRALEWARELKKRLTSLAQTDEAAAERVLKQFRGELSPKDVLVCESARSTVGLRHSNAELLRIIEHLLPDGPILAFCFDRRRTEHLVELLTRKMEDLRRNGMSTDSKAEHAQAKRSTSKQTPRATHGSKMDRDREQQELASDGKKPSERYPKPFTYRKHLKGDGRGSAFRDEIIEHVTSKLGWDESHILIRGLHYGVACHHAGLPHKYRVAAEVLFRTKDVTVLFSTETLAQGIQAPARSVVIVEDSRFLDVTAMLQMIGRAGRRGYDKIGHAVFFGIRYERLRALLTSPVPPVRGSFQLSPSLVLRLEVARPLLSEARVTSLLRNSLHLTFARSAVDDSPILEHSYAFSKRLLQELQVLDSSFLPIHFAGMCTNLSWVCPANLLFVFLVIHDLIPDSAIESDEQLVLWLSCIFLRKPVLGSRSSTEHRQSCRVIERVPQDLMDAVARFNDMVKCIFIEYAQSLRLEHSCCLPLSNVQIGSVKSAALRSTVSLFARTSGKGASDLSSLEDFVWYSRLELNADHSSVPLCPDYGDFCNSFLLDFYKMEEPNVDVIERECRVKNAFDHISAFVSVLKVVTSSMILMKRGRALDALALNIYNLKEEEFEEAPAELSDNLTLLSTMLIVTSKYKKLFAMVKR